MGASNVSFGNGSYAKKCLYLLLAALGLGRVQPLPSPGAAGFGKTKTMAVLMLPISGNQKNSGFFFFYYKSAFLKVWAGNPRHRNQLELIFKYRLLVPIRNLLNLSSGRGPRTCTSNKHLHGSSLYDF